jgi:hypothetical protein
MPKKSVYRDMLLDGEDVRKLEGGIKNHDEIAMD